MKKYTIEGTVTYEFKTVVTAENEDKAEERARNLIEDRSPFVQLNTHPFDVEIDSVDEE